MKISAPESVKRANSVRICFVDKYNVCHVVWIRVML